MIQSNILFLIFFLIFPLSSCTLKKEDIKKIKIQKEKISEDNLIPKVLEKKPTNNLGEEFNIPVKTSKQN